MNSIRPFEVGTTVKWCDNGRECVGIIVEVCLGTNRVAEAVPELAYLIRRPDLSEVAKIHKEIVLV